MGEPARREATYEDLYGLPENVTGEIISGELIVTPRPSRKHVYAASFLGGQLVPPYGSGRGGGPGGWVILIEPEIRLGDHILVPDLGGWRRDRFPTSEETNWISVAPDWVCEVLSPATIRVDKIKKMPIYAQYGVRYCWLIDPLAKILDAFRVESGRWALLGSYVDDDQVRAEPFEEAEIELGNLWLE
jgi:Uma2 family endonuclease